MSVCSAYSLYLVHPFIIGTLMRLHAAAHLPGWIGYWPFIALNLALTIAAAFAAHRWIELPVARRLSLRRLEGKPVFGLAKSS